ncbi:formyltetrahydrofolate deformylase [Desulfovibrio sulfodismutans]|uniref:Formyltetrahydrofolate deformylase n=1 Tax=Desulfolutivibrio sulfodismutans TaxID=63561 RepID=A0A7K3NNG4_9BACT|nr:formyltetrahydrofolate deformylase [Desulfolutivibrio sulfodismutans]NDY57325.1 formyltetrahydrofolate deformylase [Desulfolutivibrio sulfodismutans]QLA13933.1 formyltetrahydrofolate deformylase [Desulfolutivibrio sulfodismutans DSM 3696]
MSHIARLLITCPDRPGIVSAVTTFLYTHGANIIDLDQHSTDPEGGTFFLRLEFHAPVLDMSRTALETAFGEVVGERFGMDWRLSYADDVKTVAVLASRQDHCLMELLWRYSRKELPCRIAAVISNHPDVQKSVESFGAPFFHVPVTDGDMEKAEATMLEIVRDADLVVLARYMRVLSGNFVSAFPDRIINIHHSFLPAFVGADPYRQAHDKGVKLIGATAHYVTAELDAGPIIEQDTARVNHRFGVADLKTTGSDLERTVLARAVTWHLQDRVIVHGNKTVVFR